MAWHQKYLFWEKKISRYLKQKSITFLCFSIGIIYFWYGLLKAIGISPAEELVIRATHWVFSHEFVIFLGIWEMLIGILLFIRPLRRYGLWLLFLHFPGTFLPLFTNPGDCFTVFPYGLTLEGQYIFKNLITLTAALAVFSSLHRDKEA